MSSTIHHRVKGKPAIVKRLGALLIATHRFARCRAATPDDQRWAARLLDHLQTALNDAQGPATIINAARDQATAPADRGAAIGSYRRGTLGPLGSVDSTGA